MGSIQFGRRMAAAPYLREVYWIDPGNNDCQVAGPTSVVDGEGCAAGARCLLLALALRPGMGGTAIPGDMPGGVERGVTAEPSAATSAESAPTIAPSDELRGCGTVGACDALVSDAASSAAFAP